MGEIIPLYDGLTYTLPKPPPEREMINYNLKTKDQKWIRPIFPSDNEFNALTATKQIEIVTQDLIRRQQGVWVLIKGEPCYFSNSFYFYLTHWFMAALTKDGYPEYRSAIRKWFYFIDRCEKDNNCFGGIMLTQKRSGKTEGALAHEYNMATNGSIKDSLFGMQSLTSMEAKNNLFKGRIMRSHKRIPLYLKPIANDLKTKTEIVSELTFHGEKTNGKYSNAINNIIDHRPTLVSAYQGKRPREILLDEPGTVEEMDVMEWWTTVKQQLALGKDIFGKAFMPTTLETMKNRGAITFLELWKMSDYNNLSNNGRTQSGLYRYFKPFHEGYESFIDEYGNDETEAAIKFRDNEVANAPNNDARRKIKRQYPMNTQEAFDVSFTTILEEDVVLCIKDAIARNDTRTDIIIKECRFFEVGKEIKYDVSSGINGCYNMLEDVQPGTQYIMGVDPTQSSKISTDKGSDFCFVVFKEFQHPEKTNYIPIGYYKCRPDKMEDAYKAMYMVGKHYSRYIQIKILGESNVGQGEIVLQYFKNRNFAQAIVRSKKTTPWVTRDEKVKEKQFYLLNKYIPQYGYQIGFNKLLEELLKLEQENTDLADAFLMCILQLGDIYDKASDDDSTLITPAPRMKLIRDYKGQTKVVWEDATTTGSDWNM